MADGPNGGPEMVTTTKTKPLPTLEWVSVDHLKGRREYVCETDLINLTISTTYYRDEGITTIEITSEDSEDGHIEYTKAPDSPEFFECLARMKALGAQRAAWETENDRSWAEIPKHLDF